MGQQPPTDPILTSESYMQNKMALFFPLVSCTQYHVRTKSQETSAHCGLSLQLLTDIGPQFMRLNSFDEGSVPIWIRQSSWVHSTMSFGLVCVWILTSILADCRS